MRTLLIDDVRNYSVDSVARNATQGKFLLFNRDWDLLMIDHDLGEETSGYDIINWALEKDCMPEKVQIVSMNPVGRKNIERALENAGYRRNGLIWEV